MKAIGANRQASLLYLPSRAVALLLLVIATLGPCAVAQRSDTAPVANAAPLSAEQVVYNLSQMNLHRKLALHGYQGRRTYRAEYHGFFGARSAEMVVSVKYLSGKKEFTIQSATGSKIILDKVLKKLLEAENEATEEEAQRQSALSNDNYRFTLVEFQSGPSGATYKLRVEPRKDGKFLYRGLIWVDAKDFAVVRLEAEPAKNPSLWTKSTEIVQVYTKVSDFWLPSYNHSDSAIRLGGRAEMTIDYKDYEITGASQVGNLSKLPSVPCSTVSCRPDESLL